MKGVGFYKFTFQPPFQTDLNVRMMNVKNLIDLNIRIIMYVKNMIDIHMFVWNKKNMNK